MASPTYLDTHVLALLAGDAKGISRAAAQRIRAGHLLASPMAILELQWLYEIGRINISAAAAMERLRNDFLVGICDLPFALVADTARGESWTRDPFDRIIVAHARTANARLVTKDAASHRHYRLAVW